MKHWRKSIISLKNAKKTKKKKQVKETIQDLKMNIEAIKKT